MTVVEFLRLTRVELVKLHKHALTWGLLAGLLAILGMRINGLYAKVRGEPSVAELVDEYMLAQGQASGAWEIGAAVLIAQDGQILVSKGYGLADRSRQAPITPDTVFPLGPLSKPFSALAVLDLQEAGRVDVRDTVGAYLPDLPDEGDTTVYDLLTGDSGASSSPGRQVDEVWRPGPGTPAARELASHALLVRIVEQASGEAYADHARKHILVPSGMRSSGYGVPGVASPWEVVVGYSRGVNGPVPAALTPGEEAARAVSLYSSAADLHRWDRALYAEAPDPDGGPMSSGVVLGWHIGELFGRRAMMSGGTVAGAAARMVRFTEQDVFRPRVLIVVLSNTDWASLDQMSRDLAAIVFGEPYDLPRGQVPVPADLGPEALDIYVGDYVLADADTELKVLNEGKHLALRAVEDAPGVVLELYPTSENTFVTNLGDTDVRFVVEESGTVCRLVVVTSGQERLAAQRKGCPVASAEPGAGAAVGTVAARALALFTMLDSRERPADYREAAVLPGVLGRAYACYEWLVVSTILLGLVVAGQEFGEDTLRTVLSRGVSRTRYLWAKLAALAVVNLGYLVVLWLAGALFGLLTTRALAVGTDLSFVDSEFALEQLGAFARTWWMTVCAAAFVLAVYVWASRSGPALSLLLLGHYTSLLAYVFIPIAAGFLFTRPGFEPLALEDSVWAKLVTLVPHYSSRLVGYWASPTPVDEISASVWRTAQILGLPTDPWSALVILSVCGLIPLIAAAQVFKRRDITQ